MFNCWKKQSIQPKKKVIVWENKKAVKSVIIGNPLSVNIINSRNKNEF